MVELDRLKIATRKEEEDKLARNKGKDPDIVVKRASKSLGGVTVKTIMVGKRVVLLVPNQMLHQQILLIQTYRLPLTTFLT